MKRYPSREIKETIKKKTTIKERKFPSCPFAFHV